MSSDRADDKPFTRKQGLSSGVSLSWNRELGSSNPILVEPLQNQDLEQDNLQQVRIWEPLDEFNPGIDPEEEEDLIWDHSGDLQSPPIDSESSGLINIEDGVNEDEKRSGLLFMVQIS